MNQQEQKAPSTLLLWFPLVLLMLFNSAMAATVTITVNWPLFPEENSVQIYNASNTSAVTTVFNDNTATYPTATYILPDNTTYTVRMNDSFGDGWNGFGANMTLSVNGSIVLNDSGPTVNSSTATFSTGSGSGGGSGGTTDPTADADGDGINNGTDIDDDNDGILDVDELSQVDSNDAEADLSVYDYVLPSQYSVALKSSSHAISGLVSNLTDAPSLTSTENHALDTHVFVDGGGTTSTYLDVRFTFAQTENIIGFHIWNTELNSFYAASASLTFYDASNTLLDTQTVNPLPIGNLDGSAQSFYITPVSGVAYVDAYFTGAGDGVDLLNVGFSRPVELDDDNDGVANHVDLDSDDDGISDLYESGASLAIIALDANGDGTISNSESAVGGNGLVNAIEAIEGNDTGTTPVDTDNDDVADFLDLDSDADTIPDTVEARPTAGYAANDGDVTDDDTDGDGIIDLFDSNNTFGGTGASLIAPENTDTDNIPDFRDTDSDADGKNDNTEAGSITTAPSVADPDGSINNPQTDLDNEAGDTTEVAYRETAAVYDYGDAPTSGTAPNRTNTNAYGEARHGITSGLHLGATAPDEDSANQPSYNARGDGDDEDGAPDSSVWKYQPVFPLFKETDTNYTTPITVTNTTGGAATLFGWIDFDGNGTFDADEGTSVAVANGTSLGTVSLTWNTIPSGVNVATTFMRLRLTTDSSITTSTPTGNANNGEVEDFTFGIAHTIPPDSPSVNVINEPAPQSCQTVLFEDTFNDMSFMKIGEEYTGSSPIRDWSFTGGGTDTYGTIGHLDATNRAVYFGNGAIRQILPSFYTANPTFDANGRLIETIEAISLRDNPDDVSPGSSSDSGSDWGPEPVKLSRDFTTVAGKTYRIYVTLVPESGTKVPGIMRVDTPAGSVHTKVPASSETSGISYAIEFTATGTTSNIGFVNYGHINSAQGEWCDQTAEQWCTVGGLGGSSIDTNELMLDNVILAEADCPTPGSPGRAAPVVDLNGEALGGVIAGWSHHTPTSTLNADFTFSDPHTPDFGTLSFSGANPSVVNTSASTAETLGSSVSRTFVGDNTVMQVSGVTQSTYTDAKGAEDYVEYTITTTGSLSADAVIDQLGYGTHQTNGGSNPATAPYKFTVEVSDNNFTTSDILVLDKQVAANSGAYAFLTYDVADYKLSPSTTYTFRVYLYDDDNGDGNVIWDDFAISVVDDPTDYTNTFTQSGAAVDIADAATTVEDADDTNMTSGSIVLTNAFAGDFFVINGTTVSNGSTGTINGLSYTVTESGGQITIALSGSGTKATYATTISQIQFDSSAAPINTTDRIIHVTTNDGTYGSNTAVSTIDIIAAVPPSFTCSTDLYLTAGDPAKMYSLDLSNAIVGQNEVVSSFGVSPLNATAYNTADNYIYTIERFAPHNLVRIHADGTSAVLGAITGFDPATAIIAGDFNATTGTLVVVSNGPTHLYEVNITTRTATLPGPYIGGPPDIAFNTADNKFYGVNGSGEIYSYDPANNYASALEGNLPTTGNHGATFFDSNGIFYVLHNDAQTLYSYNLTTDIWTVIGTGIGATNHNDGTSCNTAAAPIQTGAIAGNVYVDTDGGDDFDAGTESGIGSVTVSLYFDNGTPGNTADDTLVSTRETVADGSYNFADVNASAGITYRVEVDEADSDLGGRLSGTTNPVESIAVTAGSTTTVDFGFDPALPTFTCGSTLYVITGVPSIIREVNFTPTGATYNDLGNAGTRLNAGWGYNVLDNFIYGIPENTKDLYRIGADGVFTNLATISALPAGGGNAGTVLPNGELLTKLGDSSWTAIDLTTQPYASTRAFNLSGDAVGLTIYDVAYNPIDGLLYTVATNLDMITIDPATGVGTKIGTSTVFLDAAWFDEDGQLYGYNNGLNQYYSIAANGAATLLANNDVDDGSATDGAGCRGGTPLPIGTLAGTVYEDSDLSDSFNSGTETGITDVTVSLYFDNGTPGNTADDTLAATTQTAADGSYSFNAVNARADRSYRIEVDEADTDLGGRPSGTTNPVESITVTDGGTTTVDFGFDPTTDYSDAPLTGTTYGSASHTINASIILGSAISAENAAYDSANADGDANDDGITLPNLKTGDGSYTIAIGDINATGTGTLHAWVDFDGNNTFDTDEHRSTLVTNGVPADTLSWTLDGASGNPDFTLSGGTNTFARFRFTSDGVLQVNQNTPASAAGDGEVEDYRLTIDTTSAPPLAQCTDTTGYFKNPDLEDYACVVALSNFGAAVNDWDLIIGTAEAFIDDAPACQMTDDDYFGPGGLLGTSINVTDLQAYSGKIYGGVHNTGSGFGGTLSTQREVIVQNLQNNLPAGLTTTMSFASAVADLSDSTAPNAAFHNPGSWQVYGVRTGASYTPPGGNATCALETDPNVDLLGETNTISSFDEWEGASVTFTTLAEYDRLLFSPKCGLDSYLLFDCLSMTTPGIDYGDAPSNYGSAAHVVVNNIFIGSSPADTENAPSSNANATGDDNIGDDEDAVTLPALEQGQMVNLDILVSGAGGYLQAWFDWNGDGDFLDKDEQVASDLQDGGANDQDGANNGAIRLKLSVPARATTNQTFARFRWSTTAGLDSTTTASDGEVEDYALTIAQTATGACGVPPKIVFILDDSGSIDNTERAQMQTAIQSIADGVEGSFPNTEFGVLQYSQANPSTPNDGQYAVVMNFASNPTFSVTDNAAFIQDHLPDSIDQMIDDGLFSTGGAFDNTDAFFIFTDATRTSASCCSVLENTGTDVSTDADPNFGEYQNLANLANSGDISLYHVSDVANQSPEVAQGDGIYRSDTTFTVSPNDINAIIASLCDATPAADYGDAPVSGIAPDGSSTNAYGEASHTIVSGTYLGSGDPDADTANQPDANAAGDDNDGMNDEDGINISSITFTQDQSATITATVNGAGGYLQGWIDWNGDGTFDAGEQIATDYQDNGTGDKLASNGLLRFTVPVPADTTLNQTFARFRWSTTAGLDATTAANDGEVEDYALTIQPGGISVSGRVYNDTDADGIDDAAEIGISKLPVVLYDTFNGTCVSTRTDGDGHYSFNGVLPGTYQVYEASRETVPTPQNCDPGQARDPSGYLSTTDSVSIALPVTNADITGINFGDALLPNFASDNAGTVLPGNVAFYQHIFTAPTTGNVTFNRVVDAPADWGSLLHHDADCSGDLNGAEADAILTTPLATLAGTDLCILHKVLAPGNAATGQQSIVSITADFIYGNGTTLAANQTLLNEDITTVFSNSVSGEGKLALTKTVQNITQGTPETDTQNTAEPGDILQYRMTYRNTGTAPLTNLDVSDTVPAFTLLDTGSIVCANTPATLSCLPDASNDPDISWSFSGQLEAGASGSVTYRVTIK